MEFKSCATCLQNKPATDFNKDRSARDGRFAWCKPCTKIYRSGRKDYQCAMNKKHKASIRIGNAKWRAKNRKVLRERSRVYRQRPEVKARKRHRESLSLFCKTTKILRERVRKAVKLQQGRIAPSGIKLRRRLPKTDLGCSLPDFISYIEAKFLPGMSWDNWTLDGWHLDHVIPLANFDLSNPEQLAAACHYSNMQPLWAVDNLVKWKKPTASPLVPSDLWARLEIAT